MENKKIDYLEIKELYKGNCSQLFLIADWKKNLFIKSYFIISIIVTLLLTSITLFSSLDNKKIIEKILELVIPFFGALVGFSLSGFIISTTFGDEKMINKISRIQINKILQNKKDKFSYLQKVSSKYALIVIIQFIFLIIFLMVYFIFLMELKTTCKILSQIVNTIGLFVLIFMTLYGTLLTLQFIINFFTISQSRNLFFLIEELERLDLIEK